MAEMITVDGKVYPLRRRSAGSGRIKLTVGTNYATGKQIQHDYTGSTAEDVQKKVDASRRLSDEQMNLTAGDVIFSQLCEDYLRAKMLHLRASTIHRMQQHLHSAILPYFAPKTTKDIRKEDIRAWQRQLLQEGHPENDIARSLNLLKEILEFGRRRGNLCNYPCRYARETHRQHREQAILNDRQLHFLLEEKMDHPLAGLLAVMLLLGLRLAEAVGLSWKQIHWETRTVCICQMGTKDGKVRPYTKTGVSRTLRMPEAAVLYLRREEQKQQQRIRQDPLWRNEDDLVFTDRGGKMIPHHAVAGFMANLRSGTGGPNVSAHSLRRTAGSVLAESVSLHAAQYYLGHMFAECTLRYVYPVRKDMDHLFKTMETYYGARLRATGWIRDE